MFLWYFYHLLLVSKKSKYVFFPKNWKNDFVQLYYLLKVVFSCYPTHQVFELWGMRSTHTWDLDYFLYSYHIKAVHIETLYATLCRQQNKRTRRKEFFDTRKENRSKKHSKTSMRNCMLYFIETKRKYLPNIIILTF